nr:esterase-like activity of phytase family protein [Aeoliella straminimaris]
MSGVTYLGSADGVHQFAAVQDDGGQLVRFTAGFDTNGAIQSAVGTSTLAFGANLDFEGIAYTNPTRQSVFVSAENTPTIYEYSLADGMQLQTVAPPPAFDQQRSNRGLESLTRSLGGTRMWTANEEALSIDGPLATPAAGTTVRLQQFDVMGDELAATRQFAYEVDPIHLGTNPDRSGVADLVEMPNGALLVLERSAASFIPPFENRIYEVDLSGATDTSASEFDTGLAGQSYAPAGKSLLWSGQAGGGFGQNLEGLTLGPQLADGSWVLVGVVDDGDSLSTNTVVAFQAIPSTCELTGDYNCSGVVDAEDYQVWRDTFGSTEVLFADGNGEGMVDIADYPVWRNHLGASVSSSTLGASVPEPTTAELLALMMAAAIGWSGRRCLATQVETSSGSNNSSLSNSNCGSTAPQGRFSTPTSWNSGC